MLTKEKARQRPTKRTLTEVSEGFREIEACFEIMGFFRPEEMLAEEKSPEEETEDESEDEDSEENYDEDEDSGGTPVFDREEIEVSIDLFISNLVSERIIRPIRSGKQPALANIFERIFGKSHKIVTLVAEFEEHIEGYFGAIGYDDMRSAYGIVCDIRDTINKEMG